MGITLTGWRRVALVFLAAASIFFSAMADAEAARKRLKRAPAYSPPQAAVIADGHTGKILHSDKADEARFPASLTKVMTLYIVFEFLREGRIAEDTDLAVTAAAAAQPPTKINLKTGDTIQVKDAIRALITKSANDAAVVIGENLAGTEEEFARLMTAKAIQLGMKNTVFRNASGLPNAEQKTTAYDLMVLGRRILQDFPQHAGLFKTRFYKHNGRVYKNHNTLLFNYAGCEGLKTGFTNASGFNLMTSARRDGKYLIGIVLGGRSARDRNDKMRRLLNAAWKGAKEKPVEMAAAPRKPAAGKPQAAQQAQAHAQARPPAKPAALRPVIASMFPAAAAKPSPSPEAPAATEKASPPAASAQPAALRPGPASRPAFPGPFHVQVGAYETAAGAMARLQAIAAEAGDVLAGHPEFVIPGQASGREILRARFGAFTETAAFNACTALRLRSIDCAVMRAD